MELLVSVSMLLLAAAIFGLFYLSVDYFHTLLKK